MERIGSVVAILTVLVLLLVAVFLWGLSQRDEKEALERQLEHYQKTFITADHFNEEGQHRILSIDGGKTFYAVGWDGKILGPAEEICPKALAFHRLTDRLAEGEPLDPTDPGDRVLLEAAGFDIVPAQ